MHEEFDVGERHGLYLKPMLYAADGTRCGGDLFSLERARDRAGLQALDAILRAVPSAVCTPPIFASDALEGANPLFALRALREFVWICLAQCGRLHGRR